MPTGDGTVLLPFALPPPLPVAPVTLRGVGKSHGLTITLTPIPNPNLYPNPSPSPSPIPNPYPYP